MYPLLLIPLAFAFATSSLFAQSSARFDVVLENGQGRPGLVIDSVANDTVYTLEDGRPYAIPVSEIGGLYGPVRRSLGEAAAVGLLIGALGGIVWASTENEQGWFINTLLDSSKSIFCDLRVLGGTLAGGLLGAAIGALFPQREVYEIHGAMLQVKLDAIQRALGGKKSDNFGEIEEP